MSLLQCCFDCVDTTPPLSEFRSVKIKTKCCYLMKPFTPIVSPKVLESFSSIEVKCSGALYLHKFRQRALKWWPWCTEWTANDSFSSTQKQLMWLCRAVHVNVRQHSKCGIKIIECKLRLSTNSGCMSLWYWILWRFEKSFSRTHFQRGENIM